MNDSGATPPEAGAHATRAQRIGLLVGLIVAAFLVLYLFSSVLIPFVTAGVLAYVLDPAANRLVRWGLGRGLAALLLILAVVAAALLFALLLYPLIILQASLLLGRLPIYAHQLQVWAQQALTDVFEGLGKEVVDEKLRELVGSQASAMLTFVLNTAYRLIGGGFAIFNVLAFVIVTPFVGFYLLRDWHVAVEMVDSWLPRRYVAVIRAQAREVDRILSAWVRGQALCCVILAVYYVLALQLVGLDFGLIIGLAAGLLSFIPYVGSIIGGVTSLGLAMAQFPDWSGVAMVAGVLVLGHTLEGYVIYPRYLGDKVELPAVWVIFSLFAGGAAFGFLGVMLAVPMAATVGVLGRFWLRRYLASPLYHDPGASPPHMRR
jgi:predicted PurR-regulated permease PerM